MIRAEVAYYKYASRTLLGYKGVNNISVPEPFQVAEIQGRFLQWIVRLSRPITLVRDQGTNGKRQNLRCQRVNWRGLRIEGRKPYCFQNNNPNKNNADLAAKDYRRSFI